MSRLETDIAVIATGPAGLAAAISAAQSGARVVAFEKGSTTGGTANMGMGLFGVESRLQKLKQMGPTRDEAFKIFMDYTHWRVDAQLVRAYIDKAATTIDWLEDLGVEFLEPAAYFPGGAFTWHIVKPAYEGPPGPMAATAMMKVLTEKAKEFGIKIMLQTPVVKILKEGKRIRGVMAEDKGGASIQADAKAVVIATGGFGDDPKMIKKYTGYEWGKDIASMRVPGLTGDGIKMAWGVGAAPSDMNMELTYGMPGESEPSLNMAFRQPHMLVNLLGERFIDEGIMHNATFTGNAIGVQKDKAAFLIFDETIKSVMETKGFDSLSVVFPLMKPEKIEKFMKMAIEGGNKNLFIADSLDQLASMTGIDPEGLQKTVDEYNGFCEKGHDDKFNKAYTLLRPIKKPKYYAARLLPSGYGSLGGIKINYRTEVLDKKWNIIPGLYAAGTDACSIYGDSYVFVLPGNTMGFAMNTGRIAGENAATFVKSSE
jgi:fumarate reductase flavoprotein subunit